jgi:hypothetical protein
LRAIAAACQDVRKLLLTNAAQPLIIDAVFFL